MLAENLVSRITLDSLRARVPRANVSVAVEHEDCVIGRAVNEQAEGIKVRLGRDGNRFPAARGFLFHAAFRLRL
jgi:hypothetical protein